RRACRGRGRHLGCSGWPLPRRPLRACMPQAAVKRPGSTIGMPGRSVPAQCMPAGSRGGAPPRVLWRQCAAAAGLLLTGGFRRRKRWARKRARAGAGGPEI
ncbi:unnamed protein product, partial [Prorocentrum cordatum]